MKRLLYLGIALFLIVFEAVPEGLALGGHKMLAGMLGFVFLAAVILVMFGFFTKKCTCFKWITYSINYWYLIAGYVLLRLAIFDIVHNVSAGLPAFYLGSTKLFDIVMVKLASFGWFMRFIGGIIGITWLVKK